MNSLFNLIKTSTAKDSGVLFIGTIFSNIFNFLLIAILSRNLSVAELGLLLTALTFSQLIIDCVEFGINPTAIHLISSNSNLKQKIINETVQLKFVIGLLAAILVFIFSSQISSSVFNNLQINPLIQISALGIGLMTILNWGQAILQAQRKFNLASLLNLSPNLFRIIIIPLLLLSNLFNLMSVYWTFYLVLIISLFFLFMKVNVGFKLSQLKEYSLILKRSLPIGLAFMLAAIYTRLDQLFVFNLLGADQSAFYGLASRLILVFIFAVAAFNSAIAPRFASIAKVDFYSYFQKTIMVAILLAAGELLAIVLSPIFIPLLFGNEVAASVTIFQILTVGMIFFTLSSPIVTAIFFHYQKRYFQLVLSILSLIMVLWGMLNLLPQGGVLVAALVVSAVYFVQFILSVGLLLKLKYLN